MNIYKLKLYQNIIPVDYDYYSAIVLSARSEEEARNLTNKELYRGSERNLNLEVVKEFYMSYDTMKEKFKKHDQTLNYNLYRELMSRSWGHVEDNEIWKNPEFTEIMEIGSSLSTEPEVHTTCFHAG